MSLYGDIKKSKYREQLDRILDSNSVDVDGEFLGFTDFYKYLAKIIPKDYDVYDFGCAYNFQNWYFRKHASYHAIEPSTSILDEQNIFKIDNTLYHNMTTAEFLRTYTPKPKTFAIVNYVPPWYGHNSMEEVKKVFENVFTYYPCPLATPKGEKDGK